MSIEVKHKHDATNVVLEEEKYQVAPHPHQMFKPLKARAQVEELLQNQQSKVEYDPVTTPTLTSSLAVEIKNCLKDLNLPRYKYMVQVVIAENKGAGMRMGARCMWDPKTDCATEAIFMNDSIYCCASVFAIYIY